MHGKKATTRGFTLIEILVVIGMIALLATVVLVAINPGRQFAQARNAQRESHVNTILNALGQHLADNKGVAIAASNCTGLSTVPDDTPRQIGTGAVNLGCLVPTYLPTAIPVDPTGGTAADTLYTITASTSGRYTVCAPLHAEAAISGSAAYCLSR